jgi:hypothetical protein
LGFNPGPEPKFRRQVMQEFNKFIGLDVHKSTIAISIAPLDVGEVRYFGEIKNTKEALTNFANKISQGSLKL